MIKRIENNKPNVIIISAEQFPSFGPISIASMLINNNIPTAIIQCLIGFSEHQISQLVNSYICDESQVIGVSTTFSRTEQAISALRLFLILARNKFPKIKIIIGGANDDLYWADEFENAVVLNGQNKEQQILDWFINNVHDDPRTVPFSKFSFTNSRIRWSSLFSKNPPRGFTGFLELTRSCIFNCSFCAFQNRGQKLSYKNIELIKKEIEDFRSIFPTQIFYLTCNTFNDDEEKIELLKHVFDALDFKPEVFAYTRLDLFSRQSSSVKKFYTDYVKFPFFGIESMNGQTLKNIKKGNDINLLKRALIEFRQIVKDAFITSSVIIGLPYDKFDDYRNAIDFLGQYSDFINVSVLRLNQYVDGQDKYSFSNIELFPKQFGYEVLPKGKRTFSFDNSVASMQQDAFKGFPGWIRNDGYDFEHAIQDAIKIENMLELPVPFANHIFLRARGIARDEIINAQGCLTQNKMFVSYDNPGNALHPGFKIQGKETFNFYQSLFSYYISEEQVRHHEKQI